MCNAVIITYNWTHYSIEAFQLSLVLIMSHDWPKHVTDTRAVLWPAENWNVCAAVI